MESFLSTWAISVTIAILFSAIVSMLLPESGIKKYVSVVMGVVVTIIILSPVISLLSGIDVETELRQSFSSAGSGEVFETDAEQYKDYIYDLYQVYMGDDSNKYE